MTDPAAPTTQQRVARLVRELAEACQQAASDPNPTVAMGAGAVAALMPLIEPVVDGFTEAQARQVALQFAGALGAMWGDELPLVFLVPGRGAWSAPADYPISPPDVLAASDLEPVALPFG